MHTSLLTAHHSFLTLLSPHCLLLYLPQTNALPLDRPVRIGVTSGASTPDSVVQECVEALIMLKKLSPLGSPLGSAGEKLSPLAGPAWPTGMTHRHVHHVLCTMDPDLGPDPDPDQARTSGRRVAAPRAPTAWPAASREIA